MKRRYCQKFSPGPARRRPCAPWITVAATRRASSTKRGIVSASERAAALAWRTAPVSVSRKPGSAMWLSEARGQPPDHAGHALAFRAGRESERHAMLEHRLGDFEHVVDRRCKPAVEQRTRAHRQHQRLARARSWP